MNQTGYVIIAVIVVIALLVLLLLRNRKQHVSFGDAAVPPPAAAPRSVTPPPVMPTAAPTPVPVPVVEEEGQGVGSEISAAIEDVVDQFMGIDAHPSGQPGTGGAGDALTTLKGLGPKAEARLHDLGVTTFEQIAGWQPSDVEAIDAQLGAFKGRIVRDRWVQQARLLAKGDVATFEAEFGKLGG